MTAIFGIPLAALLLAIELRLFEYRAQSFIPVALSLAAASSLRATSWTNDAFFQMPLIGTPSAQKFPIYLISDAAFGILSIFIMKLVYYAEGQFEKIPVHWMWWLAIVGIGILLNQFFPALSVEIPVMVLIGMAAIFTGCSRALLASVEFALEATRHGHSW